MTRIFTKLDLPRKYQGFTLLEITTMSICGLIGLIANRMDIAVIGGFFSVLLIRYLVRMLRETQFLNIIFFHYSDLKVRVKEDDIDYYRKLYF